jgi:NAD(P)-dependent dehydrogenase (short-subunit alcohol dehydrogenase family)
MVTNAGVLRDRTISKMSEEDFDLVVETHLRGTFTCAQAAIAAFREQGPGGRLVLVGSPAGQRASFGQTNYSAAKAGIVGMGRTLAVECAKLGATVNTIIPVAVTRMLATIPGLAELVEAVESGAPVPADRRRGGLGTVEDVAALVVYLASTASAEVTGQCIGVGGDRLALYSHPTEVATVNREGGWTAESIADVFPAVFGGQLQPFEPARRRAPAGAGAAS